MFEYRTSSFILTGKKNGDPLDEVDAALDKLLGEGWDFVQLTHSSSAAAMSIVLLVRRQK
ncbi:DUF4177 domain-containing protein [bacterium]|nr:MAG: DUF4177 domain-containing protein [bacterium]